MAIARRDRKQLLKAAEKYVAECGVSGVAWDEVWQHVDAALEREGVTLTFEERLAIFEAFLTVEDAA